MLVGLADSLDADQLARASGRVLQAVAPTRADELREQRLQREAETAHRSRGLRFFREGGSVRFDGSLPRVEGEAWLALLDAHAENRRGAARSSSETRWPPPQPPSIAGRTPWSR